MSPLSIHERGLNKTEHFFGFSYSESESAVIQERRRKFAVASPRRFGALSNSVHSTEFDTIRHFSTFVELSNAARSTNSSKDKANLYSTAIGRALSPVIFTGSCQTAVPSRSVKYSADSDGRRVSPSAHSA